MEDIFKLYLNKNIKLVFYLYDCLENNRSLRMPRFLLEMEDIEVEEGFMATFKVKLDFGYPRARILFYKNDQLILNDQRHEICNFLLVEEEFIDFLGFFFSDGLLLRMEFLRVFCC